MGYLDELLPSLAVAYGSMFPRLDVTQQVERPIPLDVRQEAEMAKLRKNPGMLGVGGPDVAAGWFPPEAAATNPGMLPSLLTGASNPDAQPISPNDPSFGPGPVEAAPVPAPAPLAPVAPPPVAAAPGNAGVEFGSSGRGGGTIAPTEQPAGPTPVTPYERFNQALSDNRGTLLALASGFAGARNIGEGMSRAFERAGPVALLEQKTKVANQTQRATYQALLAKGVPPADALAAAMNPEILKTVTAKYFETKPMVPHKIGTDMFGNEVIGAFNPNTGKFQDAAGNEISSSELSGGGSQMSNGGFAPGINSRNFRSDLKGDEYLNQFGPEIKSAVKSYMDGESMPTGNARRGFIENVKMIAQKYGQDIGMPADDTTFAARKQMRTTLSKTEPNSMGGQINFGNTAIQHLSELAHKAAELQNKDLYITPLSEGVNAVRGKFTDQAAKIDALKAAAQHYGEEITKFYAGSPGGEGERTRFLHSLDAAKTPQQLAAVIETEKALMHGRMTNLEAQIKGTLGERGLQQYPTLRKESHSALEDIDKTVRKMRGEKEAPKQNAVAPKPGKYMFDPATNSMKLVQ